MIHSNRLTAEEAAGGFALYWASVWPGVGNLGMRRETTIVLKEIGPSNAIFKFEPPGGGVDYIRHVYGTQIDSEGEENEDEEPDWHIASRPFPTLKLAIGFALLREDWPRRVRLHPYQFIRADKGRTFLHHGRAIPNVVRISFEYGPAAKIEMHPVDGNQPPDEFNLTIHFTDGSEKALRGEEAVSFHVSLQWSEIVDFVHAQLANRSAFRIEAAEFMNRFELKPGYWISVIENLENADDPFFKVNTLPGKDRFGDPIGLIAFSQA